MKKSLLCLLSIGVLLLFTSCAQPAPEQPTPPQQQDQAEQPAQTEQPEQPVEPVPVSVAVMKGPTGIGAAYLIDQADAGAGGNSYTFELSDAPEQVVAMLTNGSVDMAALPTNLAANLYAKTGGEIQMAAVITTSMLYMLEQGDTIQSWEDLRGKTIYATGRGANPEYVLDYLLRAHGLVPGEDVFVEFKSEHAELATLMAAGEVVLGMLPEPFVTSATMQNDQLRVVFDLGAEWQASGAPGQLAMSCVVVRKEFAEQQPQAVAEFLADMEESINYALNNVAETAQLCENHGIIPKAAVAELAIPRCNLTFISGAELPQAISGYYEVLFTANPQAIGGALPDEAFYYIP